ncbi:MAG: hypothetical protein JWN94_1890 [Betaproteobacteria bacterium]|nr:hypothetical protein [Betaproteobacteria bacterium]
MELLDRIEDQVASTGLPLFAITLAAVPCPDTPIILTLHWHGFIKEKLAEVEAAEVVSFTPVPSSALQLNERWKDLVAVDRAAMDAAWELGAWDVQRAERPGCMRPGADSTEALQCLQAFGSFPFGINGNNAVVADAPDADDLVEVAARRGYLMWLFRPVCGGIWGDYADDATLVEDGRRRLPCPLLPIPPTCDGRRETVYRFGVPANCSLDLSH